MVSSEDCYFRPRTQDELVESKNRSRTLELRSFSCPNLMHEFEFEVRISDQIQTVKMAVGRNLKFYSNCEFSFAKNTPRPLCARMRSLKSELAKLTDSIARQATETHAPSRHTSTIQGDRPSHEEHIAWESEEALFPWNKTMCDSGVRESPGLVGFISSCVVFCICIYFCCFRWF
jgi:hypothetical protein